jgi:hypothetical protein
VLFIAPPGGLFFGETSRYYRKMEIGAGGIPSDVPGSNRSNLLLFLHNTSDRWYWIF